MLYEYGASLKRSTNILMASQRLEEFTAKTLKLLEKEREAEIAETQLLQEHVSPKELQRKGVCLLKLRISARRSGLYGRMVLDFEPFWAGNELPSHSFTPGDIAGISLSHGDSHQETLASGIVSRVSQSAVSIAFDESHDQLDLDDSAQYRLTKLANDVTYRRLKKALHELECYGSGPASPLIRVLFDETPPGPPMCMARDGAGPDSSFYNPSLDDSQKEAVRFALAQREVAIIHGPPGTGKTTTVVEIIRQAIKQNLKILACAPSNIAVDNLVERLAQSKAKLVRLGHPARLLPAIQSYSLDALVAGSDESKLVVDVRSDMDKTLLSMKKARDKGMRQRLRMDMKLLRKELRRREEATVKDILTRSQVVLATLTMASAEGPLKRLVGEHFDLVVIDECSQALEVGCWIALLRGARCVLAGDHLQLPPTILSKQAAKEGLEVTLMERLLKRYGDDITRMLTVQYRMHRSIMQWSSDQLYDGRLTAHQSVAEHLLKDLDGVAESEDTSSPLLLIDTAGCDLRELDLPDEVSKGNEGEADLVASHVESLVQTGLCPSSIAVIAPYNLQVELLRLRLSQKYPKLEVKSVDGFQGREKEAVIISLVRSNDKGEVGFLAENRRINVAITRARRHLAVICDSETVGRHAFLRALVDYMSTNGEVRSAHQYVEGGALTVQHARPDYLQEQLQRKATGAAATNTAQPDRGRHQQQQQQTRAGDRQRKAPKEPRQLQPKQHPVSIGDGGRKATTEDQEREETEAKMTRLEAVLLEFVKDQGKTTHPFPPSLNSHERFLVHEVAEKLGLLHLSQGEGPDRHIVVAKPPAKSKHSGAVGTSAARQIDTGKVMQSSQPVKQRPAVPGTEPGTCNKSTRECPGCGKHVLMDNFKLHRIRCDRNSAKPGGSTGNVGENPLSASERGTSAQSQPDSGKAKKKKKSQRGMKDAGTPKPKEDEEEDFDALMAKATRENTSCYYPKCKNNAATLGNNCPFCARRFCIEHFIAEGHGCGDRAKQAARAVISREGVLYRGSGVPDKRCDPKKRVHLERKLEKKLTNMADQRKTAKDKK